MKKIIKVKITDLGRNKVNKIVEVDITKGMPNDSVLDLFIGIASHYLMSREIDAVLKDDYSCEIIVGGFRKVGEMAIIQS